MGLYAVDIGAPDFPRSQHFIERYAQGRAAHRAEPFRQLAGGGGGGVGIGHEGVIDDLEMLDMLGRNQGKMLQQRRCQREITGRQDADSGVTRRLVDGHDG